MDTTKVTNLEERPDKNDVDTLKGTLFSTLVFVGGGIVSFIVLLFVFYMTRV